MALRSPYSVTLASTSIVPAPPEPQAAELGHLLNRLRQSILHPDAERERRLRTSEYERRRLLTNLEYARNLLTRLERDALGIKGLGRRGEAQTDLYRKRELLAQLADRLDDFQQLATRGDEDSSDGEDVLAGIIPTPSESRDSLSTENGLAVGAKDNENDAVPPSARSSTQPQPQPSLNKDFQLRRPPTEISQEVRSRGAKNEVLPSGGYTTARAALFASRRSSNDRSGVEPSNSTTDAIIESHRAEQEELSESILAMATQLKESSHGFARTLDLDREVLGRAGDVVDSTGRGMESAARRMAMLTRMSEGKGWFGRMYLYGMVYLLMVAVLAVLLAPLWVVCLVGAMFAIAVFAAVQLGFISM